MPVGRPIKYLVKPCNTCLQVKDRTLFANQYTCNECYVPRTSIKTEMECTQCNSIKPLSSFYGKRRICNTCYQPKAAAFARKHKYGLDDITFQFYWEQQGAKCKNRGCNNVFENTGDACVDHNHQTGAVRGLLCSGCNTGLGLLRENPDVILGLIEYLKEPGVIHNTRKRRLTDEEKEYIFTNPDNKTRSQLAEQFQKSKSVITNIRFEVNLRNKLKAQCTQQSHQAEAYQL